MKARCEEVYGKGKCVFEAPDMYRPKCVDRQRPEWLTPTVFKCVSVCNEGYKWSIFQNKCIKTRFKFFNKLTKHLFSLFEFSTFTWRLTDY